jgi:hypothetical protein
MKLFLDQKARRFIKSAASNVALQTLVLKRRDQVPLEVVFVENGVAIDPVAGTQTTVALKTSFSDSNFLALAAPGSTILDLNTVPVEGAFSSDPASISAYLEIRWTAPTQALRTATLQVEVQNSVILGDEATPAAIPDGKATQAEAEAGLSNAKWMTPLRTAQAITALADATFYGTTAPDPAQFTRWVHTDLGRLFTWFEGAWVEFTHSTAAGMGSTAWADITGKPLTFAPSTHTHAIADTTGLQTALDGKAATTHPHAISDTTGLQTALDGKQPSGNYSLNGHTHTTANVTGLDAALAGKVSGSGVASISVVQSLPATLVPTTFYIVIPSGATTASAVQLGSIPLFTGGGGGDDGGGGGGGGFTPASISGLQLWLDASDTTTLFDASSGGSQVTTDGSTVARWQDKSGASYHALQGVANARPLLKTAIQNSKPALRFDGLNDCLRIPTIPLNTSITIFVVGNFINAKPFLIEHSANSESNSGFYLYGNYFSSWQFRRDAASHIGTISQSLSTGAMALYSLRYDTVASVAKNGSLLLNTGLTGSTVANTSVTTALNICSRNQTGAFSQGDLCEVVIYNSAITDAERAQVDEYLNNKWGVF